MDLIGPWVVQVCSNPYEFDTLTVIDTVNNLVELSRMIKQPQMVLQESMHSNILSRYPWPKRCVHDLGGEFVGIEFQTLLQDCHIRDVCTSTKNHQSNAICKRMHQTVGNVLRTLLHSEPPQNIANAKEVVDEALSIPMHEMRAGINPTLGTSPGSLVFNKDMFLTYR